jgi:hypothetical protein
MSLQIEYESLLDDRRVQTSARRGRGGNRERDDKRRSLRKEESK